jgi:hypothetical protein
LDRSAPHRIGHLSAKTRDKVTFRRCQIVLRKARGEDRTGIAQAAHFLGESFHSLRGAEPAVGPDVKALEGNVPVRAMGERGMPKFGQLHAPFEAVGRLQQIPAINQYRYSLHVSCSSEVVRIAIVGIQMSFCCPRPLGPVQSQILL